MHHVQPVQQRDQLGAGLAFDAELSRDAVDHFAGIAGLEHGVPGFDFVQLLAAQPARAAFVVEARQTFDPVFLVELLPGPDRVIVE